VTACDEHVARFPEKDEAREVALIAARMLLLAGETTEAENRLRQALQRWPEPEVAAMLGYLLYLEGDVHRFAATSRWLRREVPKAAPGLKTWLESLAEELEQSGRFAEAAELLVELGTTTQRDEWLMKAARLYLAAGEPDHALEAVDHADAEDPEALVLRALLASNLNRREPVDKLLSQAFAAAAAHEARERADAEAEAAAEAAEEAARAAQEPAEEEADEGSSEPEH
jgi:hypothetical protein